MYPSLFPIWLLCLVATVTAYGPPSDRHYATLSKRSCELRTVYFHYNNSALGSMPSCSWDVLSLAAQPLESTPAGSRRSVHPRQSCPPGECTDGPTTNYTVQAGDTLELIAATFNSGVCDIAEASGIADNPDFIENGQVLTVPTEVCDPDNTSCRTAPGVRPCIPREESVPAEVAIAAGDTFFLLGVRFNVTADAFVAANLCVNPDNLQIGQTVQVPVCPQCPDSCEA